jgi:hypothetical protein
MPSTTREFPLTEEMKQLLNVTRMYAKGKTLFLDNAKAKPISCPYIADDSERTVNGLKQALIDIREFEEKSIDKFLVLLSQVWLKSLDSAQNNVEHGSSSCLICNSDDAWLTSYLIDHLKQHLATYTELITNKEGKTAKVRIYYEQAFQLLKIGAYKPASPYIIQFSHLTSRLQTELDQLHNIDLIYVLKQAVSRIFEDINLELYHNSISRALRVVLQR